jgi:hypothetical protein
VHWAGAFAVYGGHGTTASATIVYEVGPGKRLGWHTDATEETQYIIAAPPNCTWKMVRSIRLGLAAFCHPNTGETRSRQRWHGHLASSRIFRGGNVHAKLRQRDDAAEETHSWDTKSGR